MIAFPQCKINLGLYIERRRPDGYHDIATVMFPVGWTDVLEIVPGKGQETRLFCYGRLVDCPTEKNLVIKAFRELEKAVGSLPPVDIHLEKIVPDGAGLGGGSADAAATLLATDKLFGLGLGTGRLAEIAAGIGADCPLFIYGRPMLATGTGTTLEAIDMNLHGLTLLIAKPRCCSVSTAAAYAGVKPSGPAPDLHEILSLDVSLWRDCLKNEFEPSVFALAPEIGQLKQQMYDAGAMYAAMSGSGAAVFPLFSDREASDRLHETLSGFDCYCAEL
ncbi:MAG: 4-(cytidine 5'-diphospho)-2-C-methyl-D-erythritol kinase [Muribaculaceae bacterium]|nr:4-(cytidine 5'-diphospho)-2-C-methyl-D-erythritol kinase [Muribaculaceae bacterium]